MSLKDILLLIIPILANGIVIFRMQQKHFKKNEKVNREIMMLDNLKKEITKFILMLYELKSEKIEEEQLTPVVKEIFRYFYTDFACFFETNKILTKNLENDRVEIMRSTEVLRKEINSNIQHKTPVTFSFNEYSKLFIELCNKIEEMISEL